MKIMTLVTFQNVVEKKRGNFCFDFHDCMDVGCYGLERQHLGSKELMLRVQAPTEAVIKL
jgi:hypothetical protein